VSCEARVAKDHPLRAIREIVNAALALLSPEFEKLYARLGRPSIAPEKLLRALLLQAFYSVRSERQLMEQLDYNLLFRWFVGLGMDAPVWDVAVFTKNRERLVEGEIASKFMAAVLSQPRVKELLSSEHFSVDGTLIVAWASMKSFHPKDGGGEPPAAGRRRRAAMASAIFTARSAATRRGLDQRSGCAALSQGAGSGGKAGLYGARDDGEPPWSGGRYAADPGHRHGRARGGTGHGRDAAGQPPHHGRRRQGLRCRRLCRGLARAQRQWIFYSEPPPVAHNLLILLRKM
jgi:transposase